MTKKIYTGTKVALDISIAIQQILGEVDKLINDLSLEATKMMRSGLSKSAATSNILADIKNEEGLFKSYKNRQKLIINQIVGETVARPMTDYGAMNKKQQFEWILEPAAAHCDDCSSMSGFIGTLDEIRAQGVGAPREGATICSFGCRCLISLI